MELIDVVDENNELTGVVKSRKQIHEEGLWHRQVSCWIMNEKGELLFQKRAATKSKNPNKWSKTGGHVDSGEDVLTAMQREIKEEIGVSIPEDKLRLISFKKIQTDKFNEKVNHKYFGYEYFTLVNYKLEDYIIQKEELSEVKYMTIEKMIELKKENNQNYTFSRWNDFEEKITMLRKLRGKYCMFSSLKGDR